MLLEGIFNNYALKMFLLLQHFIEKNGKYSNATSMPANGHKELCEVLHLVYRNKRAFTHMLDVKANPKLWTPNTPICV